MSTLDARRALMNRRVVLAASALDVFAARVLETHAFTAAAIAVDFAKQTFEWTIFTARCDATSLIVVARRRRW